MGCLERAVCQHNRFVEISEDLDKNPIELLQKAIFEGAHETLDLSRGGGDHSFGLPRLSEDQLRIKEEHYQIRRQYRREEVDKEV